MSKCMDMRRVPWTLSTIAAASLCMSLSADVAVDSQAADGEISVDRTRQKMNMREVSIAAMDVSSPNQQRRGYQQIGACTEFASDFEAPAYTLGPIAGQNGWVQFAGASANSNVVSNANPAAGAQHLRNLFNTEQGQGVTNMVRNDNCLPGATSMSVDVYISNAGGADYRIQPQAPTQEFLTAQVFFTFQGSIVLLDDPGDGLQFVDTGANWVCGEYKQFAIVLNNDEETIDYYYDGELIYTGALYAGTIIEHVILGSDNFHLEGEFGDFDNLVAPADIKTPGPSCVGDLNDDGVVNVSDLLILLGDWGSCPGCASDLNDDGVVNVSDMLLLLGAWGGCPELGDNVQEGACCIADQCSILTEAACLAADGIYGGDCTVCDQVQCQDGSTCDGALPISIGGTASGNTVGNPVGSAPQCGAVNPPSTPTIWYQVVGDGTTLTAATCNSSIDTSVAVYCGWICSELVCNAGASDGCGTNPFQATTSWCATEGQTYYIAVWGDTGAGDISLNVTSNGVSCTSSVDCGGPVCQQPDENCQLIATGTYVASDDSSGTVGTKVADDFHAAETGAITSVCWQGVELVTVPEFAPCPNAEGEGNPFRVTYYADGGGIPGNVLAGPFIAVPNFEVVGTITFGFGATSLISYSMDHAPVNVEAGECYWVEIVAETPSGDCLFFWSPSADGNGRVARAPGNVDYNSTHIDTGITNPDRQFCVTIELGDANSCIPTTGACCLGDTCLGTMSEAACLENCGAAWVSGQPCGACTLPLTECNNAVAGTGSANCVNGTRPLGADESGWNGEQGLMREAHLPNGGTISTVVGEFFGPGPSTHNEIIIRIYDLGCGTGADLDPLTAEPMLEVVGTVGQNTTKVATGQVCVFGGTNYPVERWTVTIPTTNLAPGNYGIWYSFNIGNVTYFMGTGDDAPNPTAPSPTRTFGVLNSGAIVNGYGTQYSSFCIGN